MTDFVPSKRHMREVLLFCFHLKKNAAKSRQMLFEAYGDRAPSVSTCEFWMRRFKSGDFDVDDKERPGQPRKFKDEDLEALRTEHPDKTQSELAEALGVTRAAISKRVKRN